MNTNKVFAQFAMGLFLILCLYGVTMTVVIVWGDHSLALKLINVWATMFGALVGLGSGYLIGQARADAMDIDKSKDEPDTQVLPEHGYPQRSE